MANEGPKVELTDEEKRIKQIGYVMAEVISTEETYGQRISEAEKSLSEKSKKKMLEMELEDLLVVLKEIQALQKEFADALKKGENVVPLLESMQMPYAQYSQLYTDIQALVTQSPKSRLADTMNELGSLLITPVQRPPRYVLLYTELAKLDPDRYKGELGELRERVDFMDAGQPRPETQTRKKETSKVEALIRKFNKSGSCDDLRDILNSLKESQLKIREFDPTLKSIRVDQVDSKKAKEAKELLNVFFNALPPSDLVRQVTHNLMDALDRKKVTEIDLRKNSARMSSAEKLALLKEKFPDCTVVRQERLGRASFYRVLNADKTPLCKVTFEGASYSVRVKPIYHTRAEIIQLQNASKPMGPAEPMLPSKALEHRSAGAANKGVLTKPHPPLHDKSKRRP